MFRQFVIWLTPYFSKRAVGRGLLVFLNTVTDPVVVTSLMAPLAIVTALRLAKANLLPQGTPLPLF